MKAGRGEQPKRRHGSRRETAPPPSAGDVARRRRELSGPEPASPEARQATIARAKAARCLGMGISNLVHG